MDILQPTHLIFILVIALLVLGPKRLPEVAKSLGKGIRDFRGALSGDSEQPSPYPGSPPSGSAPVTPATTAVSDEDEVHPLPPAYGGPIAASSSGDGLEQDPTSDGEPTSELNASAPQPVAPARDKAARAD